MTRPLECSLCGAPGARIDMSAPLFVPTAMLEANALCDACAEAAYDAGMERAMEDGPRDWCRERTDEARKYK